MTNIKDLYPRLVVEGAAAALDFYTDVLGATETERFAAPDGRVQDAMLRIGGFQVAVKDAGCSARIVVHHPPRSGRFVVGSYRLNAPTCLLVPNPAVCV